MWTYPEFIIREEPREGESEGVEVEEEEEAEVTASSVMKDKMTNPKSALTDNPCQDHQ